MPCAISGRVTPGDDEAALAKLMRAIEWMGGAYMVVREWAPGPGEHYHYVLETDKEIKQFRNKLRAEFGPVGNRGLSAKLVKRGHLASARQYVCKGDATHPEPKGNPPQVVRAMGIEYTAEKTAEYHELYWQASKEARKNHNLSFTDQVIFRVSSPGTTPSTRDVVTAIVELAVEQKRTLNDHYVVGVATMVMVKLSGEHRQEFITRMINRVNGI